MKERSMLELLRETLSSVWSKVSVRTKTNRKLAILENAQGDRVRLEGKWTGVGFGKTLSDKKFEDEVEEYVKKGYKIISTN